MADYVFEAEFWEWGGKGSWHFVTVPDTISGIIRMSLARRSGFGSVRVLAEVSGIAWKTSLFPDSKSGCYLLPVKAAVRAQAGLKAGSPYQFGLAVLE